MLEFIYQLILAVEHKATWLLHDVTNRENGSHNAVFFSSSIHTT